MMESAPPHVVILGGGSAGWITACLLHREWSARGGRVTVIESPDIGIIGVGEGSTPQLKAFFDHLDIGESEWMPACDATYKLGIRFTGWSEREGYDSYFHPFPGPIDLHTEPGFVHNCMLARRGFAVPAHPDDWFLAARLADGCRSPHPGTNFPFAPSYGYHFDAHKLGGFLRDWSVARGVEHIAARVDRVEVDATGDVAALWLDDGRSVSGNLFVDCSGFRSLIAQQALGVEFIDFGENLFNDRAVVLATEHHAPFKPQTDSIAMSAGWRWSIPLTSRVGNGYVYSSRYVTDQQAEAELRSAIGMDGSDKEARFLQMKVGRVADSWRGNCLAVGLSQGFIEPLEATALHIVIATALEFAQAYEAGGFTAQHREQFNREIGMRYDAIRDYIVAHYRMSQRSDGDYWRDCGTNQKLSDGLKAMMTAWFTHQDIAAANGEHYQVQAYSSMSWHCLFAGYGTFPPQAKMVELPAGIEAADVGAAGSMLEACAGNFAPLKF